MKAAPITRYQFSAQFDNGAVLWLLQLEVEGGATHSLPVRDGEEVPLLLDILRTDQTLYFDAAARIIRTGWAAPGAAKK